MRLFFALRLPPEAERATVENVRRLKAAGWPVQWAEEGALHLTIKFLGEVDSTRLDALAELLEVSTRQMAPVALALTGLGYSPETQTPRYLYTEARAEPQLGELRDRIERETDRLRFLTEGRPFRPHVTLGRVREGHHLPSGWRDASAELKPVAPFLVDRVVLFENEPLYGAPRYVVRAEARLG